MKTRAAVLVETGKPLVLVDLEIPLLKAGQALVEISYSGVCHTQWLECRGFRGEDKFLPHCLGHEGGGIVREVGPDTRKVRPGDAVVLSWIKGSGADVPGSVYRWESRAVNAGAITTFGRHAVISENRLTPVPSELPMDQAAMLGCAIPTGLGVVFNTAQPKPGQSLAVFGVGGIGLFAVAAASIAGCAPVIAIDVRQERLDTGGGGGGSHCIRIADGIDPVQELARLCPGGVDVAIEASGRPAVMAQALASVRPQGGTAVVVGNARFGERVELDPRQLNMGKRLLGTWGGDNWPDRDYPRYANLIRSGKLDLSPMRSTPYALQDLNEALADLESGRVARPLIDMAL